MGKKIRIGQRTIFFEKCVLTSLARKMPKNVCHSAMHLCFPFFLTILLHIGAFGSSWSFSCFFHSTFLVVGFIFPMDGRSFLQCWGLGCFPHVLGAAGAFSIHVFGSFMCFYHGCEGPFTFFTVSPTTGLTHKLFGTFFPCCELCSLISFRTVCFPPCCELCLLLCLGLCNSFLLFKL